MLRYVTTNPGKVREVEEYLGDDEVSRLDFDYTEVQSDDLGEIAARGAREAYRHAGEPVIVDDAGLFIRAFDGFPGPYSAFVEDTLGVERVWELASGQDDRRASFRCVIAYCDGEGFAASPDPIDREDRTTAAAAGPDADGAGTEAVVGYDANAGDDADTGDDDGDDANAGDDATSDPLPAKLFEGSVRGTLVPPRGEGGFGYDPIFEHDGTTFAEMSEAEKNAISHRGRALATFAEWYAER